MATFIAASTNRYIQLESARVLARAQEAQTQARHATEMALKAQSQATQAQLAATHAGKRRYEGAGGGGGGGGGSGGGAGVGGGRAGGQGAGNGGRRSPKSPRGCLECQLYPETVYNQDSPCPAHGGHKYKDCTLINTNGTFKSSGPAATTAKERLDGAYIPAVGHSYINEPRNSGKSASDLRKHAISE